MMKRIKALLLAAVMIISLGASMCSCSSVQESNAITMGQWLSLVADSFGMATFSQEKPYFSKVGSENPYFSVFQAAAEWDVVKPSSDVDENTGMTWENVLVSLVNAGEFVDLGASNKEKVQYAIDHFDNSIRTYWGNRYITLNEALPLLDTAQAQWMGKTFTESVQEMDVKEEVKNYMTSDLTDYTIEEEKILIPAESVADLKPGDVYILPANEQSSASINRVASIEVVDGKAVIVNDENFSSEEAQEYIEEVRIQETTQLDMTQVGGIYDADGNPIDFEYVDSGASSLSSMDDGTVGVVPLSSAGYVQTGIFDKMKKKIQFKLELKNGDTYVATLQFAKDDFSLELAKEKEGDKYDQKTFVKTTFKDMQLTKDIDYSWGKLKSATIKLDYKTVIEGGIEFEREYDIGDSDGSTPMKPKEILEEYKNALKDLANGMKDKKSEDDVYICKLALIEGGFASVDFIIKGTVTASGEFKVVVELEGAQGIQYKSGKLRYLKSKSVDIDFVAEAKLEVFLTPGFEINILKKFLVVELSLDLGVGAKITMTSHLRDLAGHIIYEGKASISAEDAEAMANGELAVSASDMKEYVESLGFSYDDIQEVGGTVQLRRGICLDWSLYPILRVNLGGSKSLVGKLAKSFGLSLSLEILGDDDTFLKGHIDFPSALANMVNSDSLVEGAAALLGIGATCTYDFTPWTPLEGEIEDPTESTEPKDPDEYDIPVSGSLVLSSMRVFLDMDDVYYLEVTGMPKGYSLDDLIVVSEDESIAKFDKNFSKIVPVAPGTTQITVKTKDDKYKAFLAVTISEVAESKGITGTSYIIC